MPDPKWDNDPIVFTQSDRAVADTTAEVTDDEIVTAS